METQYKSNNNGGVDGVEISRKNANSIGWLEIILRVLALILTLAASILVGVDKQTKIVAISISSDLPPFNVPVVAKSSYLSAFVYFVVTNSIACASAAISLALAFASKNAAKGGTFMMIIVIDLLMVALMFSGIGSAGAVGLIGFKGNSHLRWNKVCNVYGKFCHQVMAALALSFLAAIAYVLLVFLAASKLQRRS